MEIDHAADTFSMEDFEATAPAEEAPVPEATPAPKEAPTPVELQAAAEAAIAKERQRQEEAAKQKAIDARLAEAERLDQILSGPGVLAEMAKRAGVTELEMLTRINKAVIERKHVVKTPTDENAKRIAELEAKLAQTEAKEQAKRDAEEREASLSAIRGQIEAEGTPYPILAAHGAQAYAELAERHVKEHSASTGETLEISTVLAQYEATLAEDVATVLKNDRVREMLGLDRPQKIRESVAVEEGVQTSHGDQNDTDENGSEFPLDESGKVDTSQMDDDELTAFLSDPENWHR